MSTQDDAYDASAAAKSVGGSAGSPAARILTEFKAMLVLGVPLALTNLAQMIIGTTNVVMIGGLGADALAAAALGMNLYFVLWVFAMGIVTGVQPILAQAVGRKRHMVREMRRSLRMALWLAIGVSIPIGLILWHAEPLLRLMGQEPELSARAASFARVMLWSALPALGFMALRAFTAALDRTRAVVIVVALAVTINALGNEALIHGRWGFPALGMEGSALASVFADLVLFLGMLGYVLFGRTFRRFHVLGRFWRLDWARLGELVRVGLPMGMAMLLEIGVFAAAVILMGLIGRAELAAHQIAMQTVAIAFMVPLGIGQAGTVRVGYAVGRRDYAAFRLTGWVTYVLGLAFMSGTAMLFWFAPHFVVGLYIDTHAPENADVLKFAAQFLAIGAVFQIADGGQTLGIGLLRGLKDTAMPMVIAAVGYWGIGFPLGTALAFWGGLGGVGIWYGLGLGLIVVAVMMGVRYWRTRVLPPDVPDAP